MEDKFTPALFLHDRSKVIGPWATGATQELARLCRREIGAPSVRLTEEIERLADRRLWLACGCCADQEALPILFPRRRAGHVHLVRETTRSKHHLGCPFRRVEGALRVAPTNGDPAPRVSAGAQALPQPLSMPWSFHRGTEERQDMGRILATLLEVAGLSRFGPDDIEVAGWAEGGRRIRSTYAGSYGKLQRLEGIPLDDGTPLGAVLATRPSNVPLASTGRIHWPLPGQQGSVYMLVLAHRFDPEEGALEFTYKKRTGVLRVPNACVTRSGSPDETGPFWALVRFALKDDLEWLDVQEAHLIPALTRGMPVPVAGQASRTILRRLAEQVRYWADRAGDKAEVEIHHPLFPDMREVGPLEAVLPLRAPTGQPLTLEVRTKALDEMSAPADVRVVPLEGPVDWGTQRRHLTAAVLRAVKGS